MESYYKNICHIVLLYNCVITNRYNISLYLNIKMFTFNIYLPFSEITIPEKDFLIGHLEIVLVLLC